MSLGRRSFLGSIGAAGLAPYAAPAAAAREREDGQGQGQGQDHGQGHGHARFMEEAIAEGRKKPRYPFGAVIVSGGAVVARGLNASGKNPVYHGEIVAIDDYVQRVGNHGWNDATLYTTAEPCPMCISACAWVGIGRVVWGTSIEGLRRTGLDQIDLSAEDVAEASSSFYSPRLLLGGVLADVTDALFREAQVLRES